MNKFIKLTGAVDDKEIYVNVEHIVSFYKVERGTQVTIKLYATEKIQRNLGYIVRESPEAIMSRIECY